MMKDKLKYFLGQYPLLYEKIRSLLGTRIEEKRWANRHITGKDDWNSGNNWVMGYWNSAGHSHRSLLIEKISLFSPESILEVGCNCGPNLYLLAKKFPKAEIKGIDVNPKAVEIGNKLFKDESLNNVELFLGKADKLSRFPDNFFDVVFTDAVLIYVGPDKIRKVIKEMVRVSRKAIISLEWHSDEDSQGSGVSCSGKWKRNYVKLFESFIPEAKINLVKISNDLWPDKNWSSLGRLIEVIK